MTRTGAPAVIKCERTQKMPEGQSIATKRIPLPALTGIRIFAAYYVVMVHFGLGFVRRHHGPPVLIHFLSRGFLGVCLFFILSGFLLAYTYAGERPGEPLAGRFWQARVARIYPVYLLSLLFMLPFTAGTSLWRRLAVLFMVQSWVPGPWQPNLGGTWNFPSWSLSVEACFYLLFPFLLPALSRMRTRSLRLLAAALMLAAVVGNLARPIQFWALSSHILVRSIPMPIYRLPEFFIGAIAGILFLRTGGVRGSGPIADLTAVGSLLFLCVVSDRWASLAIFPFTLLIVSLAGQTGVVARFLSTRAFVLLGGASYCVYLLQLPVRLYTRALVTQWAHAPRYLDEFVSPLLLLLVSIIVFLFFEEPARLRLRRLFHLRPRWKWPYIAPPSA